MSTQTNNIKRAFNRAAATYDQHCILQQKTGDALLAHLKPHITAPKVIIDIGCGTGINTEQLSNLYPQSTLYALDFSDKLLQKAAARLSSKNVQFIEENMDTWQCNYPRFDIIYSNLVLHWSIDLPTTLNKLISLLNPNGVLAFSIPLVGTLKELSQKLLVRSFYSSEAISLLFSNTILFHTSETIHHYYADNLSALKSIKGVGANFVKPCNQQGLRGKAFLNEFELRQLTYVIGYFVVKR